MLETTGFFFFNDTATTEIYTLSLHDALPISPLAPDFPDDPDAPSPPSFEPPRPGGGGSSSSEQAHASARSEEHTSELQSRLHLVCRLLLEKKKKNKFNSYRSKARAMLPPTHP